ncbi:TetR/AcrR family transcriptional regulator [Oceanospirillum maris]|uniref:TetR/AcrR family transcriptional regulator n=1 Tax=Oceanospirillum maris TaxID=64977 RepID=UPI0003FB39ED|nr:TetR/AcrR family transcriptional regulator [Oceanospirillum maris]
MALWHDGLSHITENRFMPWVPEHKEKTRNKILQSAARLFTHQGFDRVSINQVMQQAGLTRGAFYKYFSSKSELYSEAIIYGATQAAGKRLTDAIGVQQVIDLYLSSEHLNSSRDVCPLAFLVSDITQREPMQQETYNKVLRGFIRLLTKESGQPEEQAILSSVLMIGGVALARAAGDSALSEQILSAAKQEAQRQLKAI